MLRRWQVGVLAVLSVFALACEGSSRTGNPAPSRSPRAGLPSSMAALGDSITAGFGGCITLVACRRASWSTGNTPQVNSHYRRIRSENRKITDRAHNFAVSGAASAALAGQADSAVKAKVEYVTILIGANDACRQRVADMTSPEAFRERVDAGLSRLRRGLPKARILVVSIPDIYRLWELGHEDPAAVRAWNRGVCPSMLANPTSTAEADDSRRRAVGERIDDYNRQLSQACRKYGDRCRYDGGSAHRVRFTLELVNHLDYFHPNAAGQKRLAEVTFPRRFGW